MRFTCAQFLFLISPICIRIHSLNESLEVEIHVFEIQTFLPDRCYVLLRSPSWGCLDNSFKLLQFLSPNILLRLLYLLGFIHAMSYLGNILVALFFFSFLSDRCLFQDSYDVIIFLWLISSLSSVILWLQWKYFLKFAYR